jgi:peptidoglycan/LPS O-acetylase OafA/YrhL
MGEHPEMPFLLAGALALAGGTAREKKWPHDGLNAVIGTAALVVIASLTAGTSFAPLIRAIGLLLVLTAGMLAIIEIQNATKKRK